MKILKLLLVTSLILVSCKMKYPLLEDGLYADIQTNRGDMLLKLYYKEVPVTVANFVALSEGKHPKVTDSLKGKRYYDGIKFHRVIPNFMIQGGDITGTGKGSAGYRFGDEFPLDASGKLLLRHDKPGVLSMANSGPATNSSQFFITHKKTNWLDGKHTIFGKIEIGQSVVDSILENDVITKVDIVRIGKNAKKFNAAKVFLTGLVSEEAKRVEKKAELDEVKRRFKESKDISKASKTSSGLQYIHLKKGTGVKVDPTKETVVHYTLYNDIGEKIDSSLDRKKPFTFLLNEGGVIPGWKEGMKLMNVGGKSRFFVPSHLGYGSVGRTSVIEPDTDLIFEVEVLSVK